MEQETSKKRSKKGIVAAVLACCLVVGGVAGVLAWLTAEDSAENVFTIGNFNKPEHDPDDDGDDTKPDDSSTNVEGFLTETNWDADNAKITPDVSIAKNPNVGIGVDSDPAYVFLYVKSEALKDNNVTDVAAHAPVFTLENGWSAVADYVHTHTGSSNEYTDGLFVFGSAANLSTLTAADADVFTGQAFTTVKAPATADMDKYADAPKITVYAYLYAADTENVDGTEDQPGSKAAALKAAKEWAVTKGWSVSGS